MAWKVGEIRMGIFRDLHSKIPMTLMLVEDMGGREWRTTIIDVKGTKWENEVGGSLYVEEKNSHTQVMVLVPVGSPSATTSGLSLCDDWDNLPDV